MADTASISALLSASAVIGALTTSSLLSWYVEVSELDGEIADRTDAECEDDNASRDLAARAGRLKTRQRALLWIAGLHGVVVATLLAVAIWLSFPFGDAACSSDLLPFFMASAAMVVGLLAVPLVLTVIATRRLERCHNEPRQHR